jgi:F0F1-type ATP synthase epsilon subunit
MAVFGKFNLQVMRGKAGIYKGEVSSLFLQGDTGEFELLAHHYPLLSLLGRGRIVIDRERYIPIKHGILRFARNNCAVLVELEE